LKSLLDMSRHSGRRAVDLERSQCEERRLARNKVRERYAAQESEPDQKRAS